MPRYLKGAYLPILGLIVVFLAIYIRYKYINFGLPYLYDPDEPTNMRIIQGMIISHDPNPHFFKYPSLMFYLNLPSQFVVEAITGGTRRFSMQAMGDGITTQPIGFWASRFTTLIFGLMTVFCTMLWTRKIVPAPWICLISGCLVALNPLLVRNSTFIAPDMFATFFATLTLYLSSMIVSRGTLKVYVFAGLAAGLAASSKYNVGLVAIAIAAAHFLREGPTIRRLGHLGWAALAEAAALIFTSPYLVLDPINAVSGVLSEVQHYRAGHPGDEGDAAWFNFIWLSQLIGPSVIFSLPLIFQMKNKVLIPSVVFIATYLILISVQRVRFERNLMPIIPDMIVIISVGCYDLSEYLRAAILGANIRQPKICAVVASVTLLGLASYFAPVRSTLENLRAYKQDPRADARRWLNEIIPNDGNVAIDAYSPHVDSNKIDVVDSDLLLTRDERWIFSHDYAVISMQGSGRFLNGSYPKQNGLYMVISSRSCARYEFPGRKQVFEYLVFRLQCKRPA